MERTKKLVLIGGGGHCKSILDSAMNSKKYSGFAITEKKGSSQYDILTPYVVGDDDQLPFLFQNGFKNAIISVGSIKSTETRRRLSQVAEKIGYTLDTVLDPSAVISMFTTIGKGCFVGKRVIINASATIGDNVIINSGAIIEHDCWVGDFSHVSVGAVLCGGVTINNDVFIGANATIIQGIEVGARSIIGAGSIVLCDVPEDSVVYGIWK